MKWKCVRCRQHKPPTQITYDTDISFVECFSVKNIHGFCGDAFEKLIFILLLHQKLCNSY